MSIYNYKITPKPQEVKVENYTIKNYKFQHYCLVTGKKNR